MTKRHQILAGFIILCLVLTGESWGQTASGEMKGGGPVLYITPNP